MEVLLAKIYIIYHIIYQRGEILDPYIYICIYIYIYIFTYIP